MIFEKIFVFYRFNFVDRIEKAIASSFEMKVLSSYFCLGLLECKKIGRVGEMM
jgi:hypothetical protein